MAEIPPPPPTGNSTRIKVSPDGNPIISSGPPNVGGRDGSPRAPNEGASGGRTSRASSIESADDDISKTPVKGGGSRKRKIDIVSPVEEGRANEWQIDSDLADYFHKSVKTLMSNEQINKSM